MRRAVRIGRALSLVGTAAVGLLAAHELDYRLLVPDPEHRHDLLLRTGHGYLSKVLFVALVVGLISVAASIALGFARERARGAPAHPVRSLVPILIAVQGGGFVILEAVERLIVGSAPGDRLALVTLVGVGVQAVAALAGAWLVSLFERVGRAVARVFAARPALPRVPRAIGRSRPVCAPAAFRAGTPRLTRGPPLLLGH